MHVKTLDEIETFFANLITCITGLPEDMVLIANPKDGRPAFGITDNVVFVLVSPETDERESHKNISTEYDASAGVFTVTQSAQRTLSLKVVFYGPNSYYYASVLSNKLFLEDYRHAIRVQRMALIPAWTTGPTRIQESVNGQWWERCDVSFRFYDYVSVDETVNTFESINITVKEDI